MRRALAASAGWLAAGQTTVGALYWTFLHTPESNALMLAVSASLAALVVLAAALGLGLAIQAWRADAPLRVRAATAIGATPALLLGVIAGALLWGGAGAVAARAAARSGEIAAWVIAATGRSDDGLVLRTATALTFWVQVVAAPVLALAIFAAGVGGGAGAVVRAHWRHALAPRVLAEATIWIVGLVILPLRAAAAPLTGIPPTWVEPAVAAGRLAAIAVAATIGGALVCGTIARAAGPRTLHGGTRRP